MPWHVEMPSISTRRRQDTRSIFELRDLLDGSDVRLECARGRGWSALSEEELQQS